MDAKSLTVSLGTAAGLIVYGIYSGIEYGALQERVKSLETGNRAQWERIVAVGAKANEVDGKVNALTATLSGLDKAIDNLAAEVRLLRQNR